ncbi:MAG: preprotein translocase subunit SecE [Candidatus Taylorbacteria bacterium]|nr:preprotein translocase subunit SecE [Candidatus Taylorbacteria bacterium]
MGVLNYIKETKNEMHLVKWPTRKQAIILTIVVIIISVVVAALLGVFDFIFSRIIEHFASLKSL